MTARSRSSLFLLAPNIHSTSWTVQTSHTRWAVTAANATCHVSRVQAEHVRRCLESGAKESSLVSLDESLTIARQTCERCLMMLAIIECLLFYKRTIIWRPRTLKKVQQLNNFTLKEFIKTPLNKALLLNSKHRQTLLTCLWPGSWRPRGSRSGWCTPRTRSEGGIAAEKTNKADLNNKDNNKCSE